MSFRLNGRWISYGEFCYDGCECDEIRFEDFKYLLIHDGETDLPDYDEERVFRVDNLKQTPPSPNKLTDITFDTVSKMVLQFVKRFWQLDKFEGWHLCHWRQAKSILVSQCNFPSVIANFTLPALDYLWPCAFAPLVGVVPDPDPLTRPITAIGPNAPVYVPVVPQIQNPVPVIPLPPGNNEGEDWE